MRSALPTRLLSQFGLLASLFVGASVLGTACCAQSAAGTTGPPTATAAQKIQAAKARAHRNVKKKEEPPTVAQAAPPPPPPDWPANDPPSPASVVWDSSGLHINASNSSLQQILREISTETGTKVEGAISDRRVFGQYGPGHVNDVLAQLLQGSGYNFLLSGDLGQGTPREVVLSPRRAAGPNTASSNGYRPSQQQADEDVADEPEDTPVQPQPQPVQTPQVPQTQNNPRQGFGPNGPIRTPQQIMEEMQQRQQQLQQQQQQSNPQQ